MRNINHFGHCVERISQPLQVCVQSATDIICYGAIKQPLVYDDVDDDDCTTMSGWDHNVITARVSKLDCIPDVYVDLHGTLTSEAILTKS